MKPYSDYPTWIIGLSGGVDSVVLLDLAVRFAQSVSQKINIIPAHLNHTTRGENSDKDTDLCYKLANQYNLRLQATKINVPALAKDEKKNFEDTARRERHLFFSKIADKTKIKPSLILLAHHKDDQLETILMRLNRKAGWRGLKGIEAESILPLYTQNQQQLTIARPLLSFSKQDIKTYAQKNRLNWREDESNQDQSYERNLLRQRLIPALKAAIPATEQKLLNLSKKATDISRKIQQQTKQIKYKIKTTAIEIETESLENISLAVFCNCIEKLCQHFYPSILLPGRAYYSLENIYSRRITATDLIRDLHLYRYQKSIFLYRKTQPAFQLRYQASPDSFNFENDYFKLFITRKTLHGSLPQKNNPNCEYISLKFAKSIFSLTLPRPGQKFLIAGSARERKISSILKKNNIPRHLRHYIPLLYSDEKPIWLVGVGLSAELKLSEFTGKTFCLEYFLK